MPPRAEGESSVPEHGCEGLTRHGCRSALQGVWGTAPKIWGVWGIFPPRFAADNRCSVATRNRLRTCGATESLCYRWRSKLRLYRSAFFRAAVGPRGTVPVGPKKSRLLGIVPPTDTVPKRTEGGAQGCPPGAVAATLPRQRGGTPERLLKEGRAWLGLPAAPRALTRPLRVPRRGLFTQT